MTNDKYIVTKEEMQEIRRQFILQFMKENKDKTVEVPVNLLFLLSNFLTASGWLQDEGKHPYPSMQWSTSSLGRLIDKFYTPYRTQVGGEEYAVYDMIHEVNTSDKHDMGTDALIEFIQTGQLNGS